MRSCILKESPIDSIEKSSSCRSILPKTNRWTPRIPIVERIFLFQTIIFEGPGYVSFPGSTWRTCYIWTLKTLNDDPPSQVRTQVKTRRNWGSYFKGMTLSQAFSCGGLPKDKYRPGFPKIGGKPPKWMVHNGKPYEHGWFGGKPIIFGNTHMFNFGLTNFFWGHGFLTHQIHPSLQMLSQSTIELTNLLAKPRRKARLQLVISFTDHMFGVVSYHNGNLRLTRLPNANPPPRNKALFGIIKHWFPLIRP